MTEASGSQSSGGASSVCYAMIEIPGIQQYTSATGKLKEMVGGSEIIESLSSKEHLDKVLQSIGVNNEKEEPASGDNWHIIVQQAAGTIRIVLPSHAKGRECMGKFTLGALTAYPGLPVLGAVHVFDWNKPDSLRDAGREVSARIAGKRTKLLPAHGLRLLPVCQVAKLDGAPAVSAGGQNGDKLSQASDTKQDQTVIDAANKRLGGRFNDVVKKCFTTPSSGIDWEVNFDKIFGNDKRSYMALIHIDGNDMGKRFEKRAADNNTSNAAANCSMKELSTLVDSANEEAFRQALEVVVRKHIDAQDKIADPYIPPLRPLVMGGDDLTLVIKAELAFDFVDKFVEAFEAETEKAGDKLTLGIGMLICHYNYPFAKAFHLAEELIGSAKKTRAEKKWHGSVFDFLVLTGEMEADLDAIRTRIYKAQDGKALTTKPFHLVGDTLPKFVETARLLAEHLPRGGVQRAAAACRSGKADSDRVWWDMYENLKRGIGGRDDKKRLKPDEFKTIFNESFFVAGTTELIDLHEMWRFVGGGK